MKKLQSVSASFFFFVLVSCTGVTSVPLGDKNDSGEGLVYFMPTTRIPLVVAVNYGDDQIKVSAGEPQYIADEEKRYRLKSIYSPGHVETIDFTVNANGLLVNANLKSEGRIDEAVVAAAKSAAVFLENARIENGDQIILATFIDVGQLSEKLPNNSNPYLARLNDDIQTSLHSKLILANQNKLVTTDTPYLSQALNSSGRLINVNVERLFYESVSKQDEDCKVGFCYRLPVSYAFTVRFFDGTVNQATFAVPNGSPIYAASLDRGVFSTWETETTLSNGMLQKYKRSINGSEAEELLLLPADIVGGIIAGITQQGALFNARSTLIQSEIDLLQKKSELQEARDARVKAESAITPLPLFTFVAGAPTMTTGRKLQVGPIDSDGPGGPSGPQTPGGPGAGSSGN